MPEKKIKLFIVYAVFLAAAAAIAYEILGASALTNLLGASIFYFSLTIGIFLAALGVGSWLSSKIKNDLLEKLVLIEIILAFLGGGLSTFIFGSYAVVFELMRKISFYGISGFLLGLGLAELIFLFLAFALIFIVGVLIGFELPLFSRILASREDLKDALGKIFFWDYAGALVASISLPVIFFTVFGLIKTSFLIGMINLVAALMLILIMHLEKIPVKPILISGLIAAFSINLLGFLISDKIELFLEKKQYGDRQILFHQNSPYQRFSLVKANDGKISLYINGQRQFESGDWDAAYHETFVHPAMNLAKNRQKILVLGGGDGLALREILKYSDVNQVILVDIDRAIVDASSNLDFMKKLNNSAFSDPRVKVVIDDAFKFVEKERGSAIYNLIFVDFPDPTDDSLSRLYSKEFYLALENILAKDGMAVIQSGDYLTEGQKTIITTLESIGLKTLAFHPPEYNLFDQNFGFTLVSREKIWREQFKDLEVSAPTKIFQKNDYDLSKIFSVELIPKETGAPKVNSLFHPSIVANQGDAFIQHYLESQPREKILAQIKLPEQEIYSQFQEMFYKAY